MIWFVVHSCWNCFHSSIREWRLAFTSFTKDTWKEQIQLAISVCDSLAYHFTNNIFLFNRAERARVGTFAVHFQLAVCRNFPARNFECVEDPLPNSRKPAKACCCTVKEMDMDMEMDMHMDMNGTHCSDDVSSNCGRAVTAPADCMVFLL